MKVRALAGWLFFVFPRAQRLRCVGACLGSLTGSPVLELGRRPSLIMFGSHLVGFRPWPARFFCDGLGRCRPKQRHALNARTHRLGLLLLATGQLRRCA